MANVKICDKCGKKLTDERSIFLVEPHGYFRFGVTLFKKNPYSTMLPKVIKTEHDLCMDCTAKLAEWLEGEEE